MFAIVICLMLFMCTLPIWSYVLCVFMVEGMSEVVKAMVSPMNVINPPGLSCAACRLALMCSCLSVELDTRCSVCNGFCYWCGF